MDPTPWDELEDILAPFPESWADVTPKHPEWRTRVKHELRHLLAYIRFLKRRPHPPWFVLKPVPNPRYNFMFWRGTARAPQRRDVAFDFCLLFTSDYPAVPPRCFFSSEIAAFSGKLSHRNVWKDPDTSRPFTMLSHDHLGEQDLWSPRLGIVHFMVLLVWYWWSAQQSMIIREFDRVLASKKKFQALITRIDPAWPLKKRVAQFSAASPKVLKLLAHDTDVGVLHLLRRNPSASPGVLRALNHHREALMHAPRARVQFNGRPVTLAEAWPLASLEVFFNAPVLPRVSEDHVTGLNLRGRAVSGQEDEFVRMLDPFRHLQDLGLENCGLKKLPPGVARFPELRQLTLKNNALKTLPPAALARLPALENLNVAHNRLSALPEELAALSRLEVLNLSYNALAALPDALADLARLKRLYLTGNALREIPPALAELDSLEVLLLNTNHLAQFPAFLGTLPHLRHLALDRNPLAPLSSLGAGFPALERLHLDRAAASPALLAECEALEITLRLHEEERE